MNFTDTYWTSPCARRTFTRIDHILGYKTSINKFKKIEILSSIFSNHKVTEPDINYKKKIGKFTKMWRLNKLLKNKWVKEKSKQKYLEKNENGNTTYENLWDAAKGVSRGEFILINAYIKESQSTWVAQSVIHTTLDFGSGPDLRAVRSSTASGSVQDVEPA